MATPAIWSSIEAHADCQPQSVALHSQSGTVTYGELVAAVHGSPSTASAPVRVVRADRDGRAVVDILAAQKSRCPALVIPSDTGSSYTARIDQDLSTFASEPGPLRGAHGLWTTTSGSTGKPKIVAHDPDGIDRFALWARQRFALGPDTVSLSLSPLNFDIATLDVWAVLAAGGKVVLAAQEDLTRGSALAAAVHAHGVTLVQAVPVILTLLARAAPASARTRTVVSTGDFFPLEALPALKAAFPSAELLSIYGSTETNDSFILDLHAASPSALGEPISGVRYRIGAGGELVVSTPFQALGYVNASNDAWRVAEGRREFHTGDLVTTDSDGTVRLAGRADRQVKVRGVRVSLDEVEAVLRQQDGVVDAVVTARSKGTGGREIVAAALVEPTAAVTSLSLRSAAASSLPRSALPRHLFLTTEPFSLTGTGKVDRNNTINRFLERHQV